MYLEVAAFYLLIIILEKTALLHLLQSVSMSLYHMTWVKHKLDVMALLKNLDNAPSPFNSCKKIIKNSKTPAGNRPE